MVPVADEVALGVLEKTAAEHFSWLKHVHSVLLFGDPGRPFACDFPEELSEWAREPGGPATSAAERGEAVGRLRRLRSRLQVQAAILTQRAAAGQAPTREEYLTFMACVEAFQNQVRHIGEMMRRNIAETDPLTGVFNRTGMMRDLDAEWQRALRTGQPCCVAIADLDHFKHVNDTFGHLAGDRVLRLAARFFVRRLRAYDKVYRYGGEEFLFCLPNTDLGQAEKVLDRLRNLMARLPVRMETGKLARVTASIGVAAMHAPDIPPLMAIAKADQALLAAKQAGRNRVCTWPPDIEVAQAGHSLRVVELRAGGGRSAELRPD